MRPPPRTPRGLARLPDELARGVLRFVTLDDALALAAAAPGPRSPLAAFLPDAAAMAALLGVPARANRRGGAPPGPWDAPAGRRLDPTRDPRVRGLLLGHEPLGGLAPRVLRPADHLLLQDPRTALDDDQENEAAVREILARLAPRRQLDRRQLAAITCAALTQRRHRLVAWLRARGLLIADLAECPRAWRLRVLAAACGYDADPALARVMVERPEAFLTTPDGQLRDVVVTAATAGRADVIPSLLRLASGPSVAIPLIIAAARAAGAVGSVGALDAALGALPATATIERDLALHSALCEACEHGRREAVDAILERLADANHGGDDHSPTTSMPPSVLVAAVASGNASLVARVLETAGAWGRWDVQALQRAARDGHEAVVGRLLAHPQCRPADAEMALRTACRVRGEARPGVTAALRRLLPAWTESPHELLDLVSAYGDVGIVADVLSAMEQRPVDTTRPDDARFWRPLVTAARHGHCGVLELLLLRRGLHDEADDDVGEALVASCYGDHLECTQLLVRRALDQQRARHGRSKRLRGLRVLEAAAASAAGTRVLSWLLATSAHPTALDADPPGGGGPWDLDAALQYACAHGRVTATSLLLADPRVALADGLALQFAAATGNPDLVALLLADPRVDDSVDLEPALVEAARGGHDGVVRQLLAEPRLRRSFATALREAAHSGHATVVAALLQAATTAAVPAPFLDLPGAYEAAATAGRYGALLVLLRDERLVASSGLNIAVRHVADLPRRPGDPHWLRFVRRFLRHPCIAPNVDLERLLLDASRLGRVGVVRELLRVGADPGACHAAALAVDARVALMLDAHSPPTRLHRRFASIRDQLGAALTTTPRCTR